MKLIKEKEDLFYLVFPFNLIKETKEITVSEIKNLFLKYNEKYHFLEPGFYDVNIYPHKLLGTILSIELIDRFDFTSEVDLKISIKDHLKLYLQLDDPIDFAFKDSKIDLDTISYHTFLTLIEHGELTIK